MLHTLSVHAHARMGPRTVQLAEGAVFWKGHGISILRMGMAWGYRSTCATKISPEALEWLRDQVVVVVV